MTDNRTNAEERLMEGCEHLMVSDDLDEGLSRKWCTNCGHEEIKYD